ncbi:MAG: hypothetical protein ABEJ91_04270 [Candidatus Nanohaloarchaea archaeon]
MAAAVLLALLLAGALFLSVPDAGPAGEGDGSTLNGTNDTASQEDGIENRTWLNASPRREPAFFNKSVSIREDYMQWDNFSISGKHRVSISFEHPLEFYVMKREKFVDWYYRGRDTGRAYLVIEGENQSKVRDFHPGNYTYVVSNSRWPGNNTGFFAIEEVDPDTETWFRGLVT